MTEEDRLCSMKFQFWFKRSSPVLELSTCAGFILWHTRHVLTDILEVHPQRNVM